MIQQKNLIILNYTQIFTSFSVPFIHFSHTKGNMDHKKKRVMQVSCKNLQHTCDSPHIRLFNIVNVVFPDRAPIHSD